MESPMSSTDAVLIGWVAYNHDPYERKFRSEDYRLDDAGHRVPGPTLTFLFDQQSPWRGRVGTVLMVHRDDDVSAARAKATIDEINAQGPEITCRTVKWPGTDPTDHRAIFSCLRTRLPRLRRRHPGELLVHISPGTPAMQTVWVLMGETGFIEAPFRLLKSLKPSERHQGTAVEPVDLDIDTFYKRYRQSQPAEVSADEQAVFWDPGLFQSDRLRRLYDDAARIARLRAPVLILGERGTGKTTLAGWMRLQSPFRKEALDEHWPAVACGQYRPDTMRSELFGHKKGSFTGADAKHVGLLERADGDTLFLDEVGDLARDMQRLLIKAVEERRFQPFGDTAWKTSTFRLITATNVPLEELRERLDADFFDRVAVLRLRAPSLREIPEELEWLWPAVYARVEREAGVVVRLREAHHARIVRFLGGHPLPGNLRDLLTLAWRLQARWLDGDPTDAELMAWLPTALDSGLAASRGSITRDLAARFADGAPLDDLIPDGGQVDTKALQRDLQAWLAEEVRRVARSRGVSQGDLVDVTPKTLRQWVKG